MTYQKMTLTEAIEYIKNHDDPFIEFGIRTDSFMPDDKFANSWYRGDEVEEYELPGVSVIKVMARDETCVKIAYDLSTPYAEDKYIFLLEGECVNADELTGDYGEALMIDHKIVGIIE